MTTGDKRKAEEADQGGDQAADVTPDPTPPAMDSSPLPPAAPAIPLYDLHTVARGVQECNSLILQGWRVYGAWIVEEVQRRGGPQRGEIRHPMPYYFLGRLLTDDEQSIRSKIAHEAAAVAADAVQPAPVPYPADQAAASEPEPEVKPAPASRRARGRRTQQPAVATRRPRTTRPKGGAGPMETQGLRG